MKKALKIIAFAIGGVVALALLLVLTLPLWLGPVVKPMVNTVVPKVTGTSFELGHLYLNPYTGRFELGGLALGNPKGYSEPVALSLSNLVFDAAMTTLCDEYVHVEEVTMEGLFVSYLNGGENDVDNFTQIQYNIAGSKEKYEAAKEKAEKKSALEKAKAEAEAETADEAEDVAEEVAERKLVIDRLAVRNVRVRYGFMTIPVPVDIVLTDVGKNSGGATLSDICGEVWKAILKSAGSVGDGVKALGSMLSDGAAKLNIGESASKAADAVGGAGEAASKAAGAVGAGASKTVETVGEGAKKATEAVGEGAKKATDAVKNLFKF